MVNDFMTFQNRFEAVTVEQPKKKKSRLKEKFEKAKESAKKDIKKTKKEIEKRIKGKLSLGTPITRVPKQINGTEGKGLRKLIGI